MKRALVALGVAALLTVGLTGCYDAEATRKANQEALDYKREMLEIGKECFAAGGNWEYDSWLGNWTCSFLQK